MMMIALRLRFFFPRECTAMADHQFKEPYNIFHFLGLLAVLLIPTAPATLTWIKILAQ